MRDKGKTTSTKRAFTLIELMIVVLLMSIVYGIYFFTINRANDEKNFSFFNVKTYLNAKAKVYGESLTLIYNKDAKLCYLIDKNQKIVEEFEFKKNIKAFVLKENEELETLRYKYIELENGAYFEPTFIFKKLNKVQFETFIYYNEAGKWVYISPYFDDTKEFINKEELVSYIKKKDYLPMYGGLAK